LGSGTNVLEVAANITGYLVDAWSGVGPVSHASAWHVIRRRCQVATQ